MWLATLEPYRDVDLRYRTIAYDVGEGTLVTSRARGGISKPMMS